MCKFSALKKDLSLFFLFCHQDLSPPMPRFLSLASREESMRRAHNRAFSILGAVASASYSRWCATTQNPSQQQPSDSDDSDFVDIFPSSKNPRPSASSAQTPAAGSSSALMANRDSVTALSDQPLGVTRETVFQGDYEYTRLQLPVETPRPPEGERRANSRGIVPAAPDQPSVEQMMDFAAQQEAFKAQAAPASSPKLPYDSEGMAEKILELEVEGALDEVWQDAKTAHIEDCREIVRILEQLRAKDICVIDTKSKNSAFDYYIGATCESGRHIALVAWAVQEADKVHCVSKVKRQKTDDEWEVVPIGRIVVNLMQEAFREKVNFERKWAVCSNMDPLNHARSPVSEGRMVRAHGLWTLTLNLQDLQDFEVDYCKDELLGQK
jgi:ribosomal silencing factor RsfS